MNVVLDELRSICGDAAVLREPVQLLTYECDALPHLRETPAVVVLPGSAAEVQQVVRLCSARACRSSRAGTARACRAARCRCRAASSSAWRA